MEGSPSRPPMPTPSTDWFRAALLVALALPLAAAGCAASDAAGPREAPADVPVPVERGAERPADGPAVDGEVRLTPGASVTADGHTVRFVEVADDNRCPADVQCVVAGEAHVLLEIDGAPARLAVPYAGQPEDDPSTVTVGGVEVTVTALEPAPRTDRPDATPEVVLVVRAV